MIQPPLFGGGSRAIHFDISQKTTHNLSFVNHTFSNMHGKVLLLRCCLATLKNSHFWDKIRLLLAAQTLTLRSAALLAICKGLSNWTIFPPCL